MRIGSAFALMCGFMVPSVSHASAPVPTVLFGFELDNTSLEAVQDAEQLRLKALDEQLARLLEASGCCQIIIASPAARPSQGTLWDCRGCDVEPAGRLGGRRSVVGWVQKVSSLILNINLAVRDVSTGHLIEAGSVDIRGDTNESWSRGLSYLIRNRLHPSTWNQDPPL